MIALMDREYSYDVAVLKTYGSSKTKLSLHRCLRTSGIEKDNKASFRGSVNEEKLDCNVSRARSKVFEYAYCNSFDYFVTLTIDPSKYDRTDLKSYYKDFSQWLRNYKKKHGVSIDYLFIPELHFDNMSWHMHGLITGIPACDLQKNSHGYLDWVPYREKFGWMSIDKIRNQEATAKYITKYISKGMTDCIKELNAKMYYCSKGLNVALEIKRGLLKCELSNPDFENDWVKVLWLDGDSAKASEKLALLIE